jgi:hypothetical protein
MDTNFYIRAFNSNKDIFEILFKRLSSEEIYWKQSPEKWCPLEIICHLLDEEKDDFKVRINHVFNTPELQPPPVNPTKWVLERKYIEQDFVTALEAFIEERNASVLWLKSLESPPWDNAYVHPKFGPMSAKYFLANWLAHDMLHIKQVLRLQYDYLKYVSGLPLDYAGNWV